MYKCFGRHTAAEKDLRSMGVPPNGTFAYMWNLGANSGPLAGDPQCLTQLYQSTVDPERDLASGLVGTLLICKYESIDHVGRLVRKNPTWTRLGVGRSKYTVGVLQICMYIYRGVRIFTYLYACLQSVVGGSYVSCSRVLLLPEVK